jgi:hypothetical protein
VRRKVSDRQKKLFSDDEREPLKISNSDTLTRVSAPRLACPVCGSRALISMTKTGYLFCTGSCSFNDNFYFKP